MKTRLKRALETGRNVALQSKFDETLHQACRASKNRHNMAIALSGGSDSMALVSLCQEYNNSKHDLNFHAYIVDHGVRPESHDEAYKVKNMVAAKTGFATKVLKLKWPDDVHPASLPNFESAARALRFQSLAAACIADGVSTLLVGHHADDEVETVLLRMKQGYLGTGLASIQATADFPECENLYGARSGQPREVLTVPPSGLNLEDQTTMIENGGLQIVRPLLAFTKEQLRRTCLDKGFKWFEDRTNSDPTVGPRNVIRSLLEKDQLPIALRKPSLLGLAGKWKAKEERRLNAVDTIMASLTVRLDIATGTVNATFPVNVEQRLLSQAVEEAAGMAKSDEEHQSRQAATARPGELAEVDLTSEEADMTEARYRAALLLRKLMMLVSPMDQIQIKDLDIPTKMTFPSLFEDITSPTDVTSLSKVSVGKVIYRLHRNDRSCTIYRTPPTTKDLHAQVYTLAANRSRRQPQTFKQYSDRVHFDNRYWLRIRYRPFNIAAGHEIRVRFLGEWDLTAIKNDPTSLGVWARLQALLKKRAPGEIRFTLPAIVESYASANEKGGEKRVERLLALPTLGWSHAGWVDIREHEKSAEAWCWEIRYKKVGFENTELHEFVA